MKNTNTIIDSSLTAKDPAYKTLATNPNFAISRDYVESLWALFSASNCADKKFKKQIRDSFHQCFSEMYFTVLISSLGFKIFSKDKGPDICFEENDIYIECVAPTNGENDRSYEELDENRIQLIGVHDDPIVLRYTNSISSNSSSSKSEQFKKYIQKNDYSVSEKSQNIIAINSSDVRENRYNVGLPRIIKALFGLGAPGLYKDNGNYIQFTEKKPFIKKDNGKNIFTNFFLNEESSHISAVMYSEACAFNNRIPVESIGSDIILIHNPMAKNPIPNGFISKGVAYCLVDRSKFIFKKSDFNTNTEEYFSC